MLHDQGDSQKSARRPSPGRSRPHLTTIASDPHGSSCLTPRPVPRSFPHPLEPGSAMADRITPSGHFTAQVRPGPGALASSSGRNRRVPRSLSPASCVVLPEGGSPERQRVNCVCVWLHARITSLPQRFRSSRPFFENSREVRARWVGLTNSGARATREIESVRVCPLESRSQTGACPFARFRLWSAVALRGTSAYDESVCAELDRSTAGVLNSSADWPTTGQTPEPLPGEALAIPSHENL